MTPRQIRRAAERQDRKAARKIAAKSPFNPAPTLTPTPAPAPDIEPATPTEPPKPLPISDVQLAANRANSLLSTGPKTPEGLAISSRNSLKHGLVFGSRFFIAPDEDPALYQLQRDQFIADLQPATPIEHLLVERLAQHTWLFERATGLELKLFNDAGTQLLPEPSPISDAQLAANRANSLLSTGPKTPEGLAISSRNSLKHGLVFGSRFFIAADEDPALYELQRDQFIADLQPATPIEHLLVERLAQHTWLFERATGLELKLFNDAGTQLLPEPDEKRLTRYQRYASEHERAANRSLNQLLKLRKDRQSLQNGFVLAKQRTEAHQARLKILQDPLKADERLAKAQENQFRASEAKLAASFESFKARYKEAAAAKAA